MASEYPSRPLPVAGPGRVPPHNIEAEQSVLGGILFDNQAMPRAVEFVQNGEDFYKPAHRLIYAAFIELFNANEPIDLMTVSEKLRKKKQLDDTGGLDYLARLMELIPTAANVGVHARIVKEKALLRGLITTAAEVVTLGYEDTEEVDQVIDRAESMIFEIAEKRVNKGFRDIRTVVNDSIQNLEKLFDRKELITGIPTSFKKFDEKTSGLQPGDLIVMAGRPSMGKTAICINMAEYMTTEHGKSVAFFSLEMSAMQLALRMISSLSRTNMHKIRTGFLSQNDWPKINMAASKLYESKIHIDDSPAQTVLDIRSKARRLKADKGLDIIFIDYLQLMSGRLKSENRVQEIAEITRGLKGLARELNVPVVAISQLSRKVEERPNKRPQLADLRESGTIEQDADVVCFVYREEYYSPEKVEAQGRAQVIIAKQRNGPVGDVHLVFDKECTSFGNPEFDLPEYETSQD